MRTESQAYRVQCYREASQSVCGVSKWHASLASAIAAMLEHQQRPWTSVALVPQTDQRGKRARL